MNGPTGLGTSASAAQVTKREGQRDPDEARFWAPRFHIPFTQRINPEVERTRAHGLAWARANELVTTPEEVQRLDAPRFDRATARFTPDATGAGLDILGDTDLWFFVFDDFFDRQIGYQPRAVHQVIDPLVAHVYQDPAALTPDVPLARVFVELYARMGLGKSGAWRNRLARAWAGYLFSYCWEAEHRSQGTTPDLDTYIQMRRHTIGVAPTLVTGESANRFELANPIALSEPFHRMQTITADVVAILNDVYSLWKELANGETLNRVMLLMRTHGWSVTQAVRSLENTVAELVAEYQELEPVGRRQAQEYSLPQESGNIERYLSMMRCLMRGSLDWHAESTRYSDHMPVSSQQDCLSQLTRARPAG